MTSIDIIAICDKWKQEAVGTGFPHPNDLRLAVRDYKI